MENKMIKQEVERIFKPIKDLDIEIRTIEKQTFNDNSNYFYVEVGIFESLGEQGDIYTIDYGGKHKPTEKQIIEHTKEHLKECLKDLKSSCMSAREETHFKALNKIKDKL